MRARWMWLCGGLIGLGIGWIWPAIEYRSSAVVTFDFPDEASPADARKAIRDATNMARQDLASRIHVLKLYPELEDSQEKAVAKMLRDLRFTVAPLFSGTNRFMVTIEFRHANRYDAQKVAQGMAAYLTVEVGLPKATLLDPASLPVRSELGPVDGTELLLWGLVAGIAGGGVVASAVYIRRLQKRIAELSAA